MSKRFCYLLITVTLLIICFDILICGARKWKNVKIIRESNLYLLFPAIIRVSPDGKYIYVLDYGDMKIKRFSNDMKFIGEYGKGVGKGPGEFINPTDFKVDKNYNVWVCDPENGIITVFKENGEILKTLRLKSVPFRLTLVENKFLVIKPLIRTDYLIEVYDLNGNFVFNLGKDIISDQGNKSILLGGWMESGGEFVYYGFERIGLLVSFDIKNGVVKYVRKTIDETPEPKIEILSINGTTGMRIPRDAPFSTMGIDVKDSLIFIKSGSDWDSKENITIIDVYSSFNGDYLYSFKIPERTSMACFNGKFFFGIRDTILTKWRIQF
ncbi:6-bladed beta-propeller [Candidatus Kryptobacter tengchongensis]|nr:6-bladed beta-propeller [Candidatus Kryptobacter tengchongensis]CUS92526.1 hypothetical protein JGI20_01499 [Candidatus Kryptobacter tengchongensis]